MKVAVFAKAPVAGEVKTRLHPILGPEGAAALQAGLVRHALATAIESGIGAVELHCAPDASHDFFQRCAERFHVALMPQRGTDLGDRMRGAFGAAHAQGSTLIIIGSDCPALRPEHLRAARDALRDADAVITPAEDGGYVLIGLAREVPGLFSRVDWGTGAVLRQTRERFAEAHVRCAELAALWDIDRPDDYARLQAEGLLEEVLS